MHHLRCNVAGLLVAVLFVAVGFAALREADELWDAWLFSLTLGLLLLAVLLAAHRTGGRRAFWAGFALFGWGCLGLSLIPSTEPRLIATRALASLQRTRIFGARLHAVRAILSPDRMRDHDLSPDDIMQALKPSRMMPDRFEGDEVETSLLPSQIDQATGRAWPAVEYRPPWSDRHLKIDRYEGIIIKASPDGDILRLKDVARVERGAAYYAPRVGPGQVEHFMHIGHTLFALLAAWLGGVVSRRLAGGV